MNGQIKILVATGALRAGIDYDFVRNVFIEGTQAHRSTMFKRQGGQEEMEVEENV